MLAQPDVLRHDREAVTQDDGPFDAVLQLADVPRPRMLHHNLHRLRRDLQAFPLQLPAVHREKVLHQQRNVLAAVPQRRDDDRKYVQPVIQVLPENLFGHRRLQVLVGGRHDADVRLDLGGASHPHEPVALEHPQHLGLQALVHVADLIQEDRAFIGQFELADLPPRRPRERPALMPEQLAFEEVLGDRRAVDGNERTVLARAQVVGHSREELFAGSAFA